ncbi:MAG TPA: ABC transporter permease [Thermoanaerobaculia bacterium]|nr:ABC transporter permease [Thermoanaerobaculia bacterium]
MQSLLRALQAELLKLRRTLALRLTVVAPLVIAGLCFLVFYKSITGGHKIGGGLPPWTALSQQVLLLWALLMMPLFIALETALLAGLEHQEKNWKLLYTQPVPRWTIYAAKQLTGMGLIAISVLVLFVLILLVGWSLNLLIPGTGFAEPAPWRQLLRYCGAIYLAAGILLSLHTWVALRWHSFVVAMAVGIAGTVAASLVMYSEWRLYYPWTAPFLIANNFASGKLLGNAILFGAVGGLVIALLGAWDLGRREVG